MKFVFWILVLSILLLRLFFYWNKTKYPDGVRVRISGKVMSEPVKYEYSQYLKFEGFKVYLPPYPEINYGDEIVVEGIVDDDKINTPALVKHLEAEGILFTYRKKVIDFYSRSLPKNHAALIAGVTLGSKLNISTEFWEQLKRSGTAHVVVASGMNVALVAGFLINFLIFYLPRRKAVPLTIIGVWIYALISGFEAPIIRAAIMGTITFSALELGRLSNAWRGLFISVAIMIFIRPEWIADYGFLLSFAATAGLLAFEARIRKRLNKFPSFLKEDLSTTLAAQIGVAPIFLYGFGGFNLLSPFYNVLVLWTIVPITLIGMAGGLIGIFFEPLGRLILYIAYPLTSWFIFIVKLV